MFATTFGTATSAKRLLPLAGGTAALLLAAVAQAAAPGITGSTAPATFNLTAQPAYLTQPDGQAVYSWGYGCTDGGTGETFRPAMANAKPFCKTMQVPGPTLIVTEGQTVTVKLTNGLPAAAGNTSILFPGFNVCVGTLSGASAVAAGTCNPIANNGSPGLLTQEAPPTQAVTYSFYAATPGTRAYYSGTQGDLQVEMGLYGAIIVLPSTTNTSYPTNCDTGLPATNPGANAQAQGNWGESDFRLAHAAYDHPDTCYDREYLFQFSEMDPNIHSQALRQVQAGVAGLQVPTEPYHPAYFMINGRSMPDDMDPNYAAQYPHQPYNGNPHMHPGELTLLRIIGQGRWQHPFHEHGNHVRVLARDGNLILSNGQVPYVTGYSSGTPVKTSAQGLAGPLLFTTTTTPGQAMDGIFYFTARGLNWDMYGHNPGSSDGNARLPCIPDLNGYNTGAPAAINYFEWCQDHNKPLQAKPFGDVAGGGPVTLPDPNLFTNGPWFGGSPYLGPNATTRAVGATGTTPPSGTIANSPTGEAGFAFMWHSHNEREITTNNIFPGGMLMMMLVDSREFVIDESQ